MSRNRKKHRLDQTVAALHQRFGPQAIQQGAAQLKRAKPPGVSTGFVQLDEITGCGGIPSKHLSLLSGKTTSGKLTVAYKMLAHAQAQAKRRGPKGGGPPGPVAIVCLNKSIDPEYIRRCGVDLDRLLMAYPESATQAVALIADLIRTWRLRAVLVDSLPDITADPTAGRALQRALPTLNAILEQSTCSLLFLDEPRPPWRRFLSALFNRSAIHQAAALHVQLHRESEWVERNGQVCGYRAIATVLRSRWARSGAATTIEILFNGTVQAQATW